MSQVETEKRYAAAGWLEGLFTDPERWRSDRVLSENVRRAIGETLAAVPAGVRTVLDAGCGDGRFASRMAGAFEVTAVDYSRAALSHVAGAKACACLSDLPFADGAFDLVLCSQVLEHLPEEVLRPTLAELRRVTRRYVLVTVPNYERDQRDLRASSLRCPACRREFHPDGHVRALGPASLATLFPDRRITDVVCLRVRAIARQRTRRVPRLGALDPLRRWVRPGWWGWWPAGERCPFCGYESNGASGAGLLPWACRQAERLLRFALSPAGRLEYRWVLALYEVRPAASRNQAGGG